MDNNINFLLLFVGLFIFMILVIIMTHGKIYTCNLGLCNIYESYVNYINIILLLSFLFTLLTIFIFYFVIRIT